MKFVDSDCDSSDNCPSDWENLTTNVDSNINNGNKKSVNKETEQKRTGSDIPEYLLAPCSNPNDEYRRQERLAKLNARRMAGDLFGSDDNYDLTEDSLDERLIAEYNAKQLENKLNSNSNKVTIKLSKLTEMNSLCDKLEPEIKVSRAPSSVFLAFTLRLIRALIPKLDLKDLISLSKKFNDLVSEHTAELKSRSNSSKKNNDISMFNKNNFSYKNVMRDDDYCDSDESSDEDI